MTKEEAIRKALQEARKEAGLSQSQAGEKLGVTRQAISQFENSGSVSMNTYFSLCDTYGISPVALMEKIETNLKKGKKMVKNINKYVVAYGDKYQEDREFFESLEEANYEAEWMWTKHYTASERKHNYVRVYYLETEVEQDGEVLSEPEITEEMFSSEKYEKRIYLDEDEMEEVLQFDSNDFPQIKRDLKDRFYVTNKSDYDWLVGLAESLDWIQDAIDDGLLKENYEIDEYQDFIDLGEDILSVYNSLNTDRLDWDDIEPMTVSELRGLASEL